MKPLPVALCLQSRLLRDGIALIIKEANYRLLASNSTLDELKATKFKVDSRFILLIAGQLDRASDMSMVAEIKQHFPNCLTVVLLDSCSDERRWQVERLDVAGVLLKSISSEALVASLKLIGLGEYVFGIPLAINTEKPVEKHVEWFGKQETDTGHRPIVKEGSTEIEAVDLSLGHARIAQSRIMGRSKLSDRELEILACLVAGNSNKVIARLCNISEATVKVHLKTILRKTEVVNRTQAAVWAINNVALNGAHSHSRLEVDEQA
ncbi:response regulator transcription factor [Lichenihabitans psoromatis]|uniref:response regulator transcription factor n=1 Tax=Lichenihabitans psoromatis TaxID=2528642 RepID=UPI001FE00F76|nr:response regulator transcription factor [Lichenihabitans psoromatis]